MVHEFSLTELALCETFPGLGLSINIGQELFPTGSSDSTLLDFQRASQHRYSQTMPIVLRVRGCDWELLHFLVQMQPYIHRESPGLIVQGSDLGE